MRENIHVCINAYIHVHDVVGTCVHIVQRVYLHVMNESVCVCTTGYVHTCTCM